MAQVANIGAAPARPRRTQEERSTAMRAALLDATIDCLVEYGYANTTTTRVVERAGVSRGAQVHHFPTKSELVAEAVRHLAAKRAAELGPAIEGLPSGRKRVAAVLDALWATHTGPLFAASLELWVAARTDPELRARLREVERDVSTMVHGAAATVFGTSASANPAGVRAAVETALAAMRGLALLRSQTDARELESSWRAVRGQLLTLFDALD